MPFPLLPKVSEGLFFSLTDCVLSPRVFLRSLVPLQWISPPTPSTFLTIARARSLKQATWLFSLPVLIGTFYPLLVFVYLHPQQFFPSTTQTGDPSGTCLRKCAHDAPPLIPARRILRAKVILPVLSFSGDAAGFHLVAYLR